MGIVVLGFVIGLSRSTVQGQQGSGERPVSGDAVLQASAGRSEVVIRTSDRLAGAIGSLVWDEVEFIDRFDHGRELQSASSFGVDHPGDRHRPYVAEEFNPTEAGSRRDGDGPTSTSQLLDLVCDPELGRLRTRTRMAFWLAPGERSAGRLARNTTQLSNHILEKAVRVGLPGTPQALDYRVTFHVPDTEHHTFGQFEVLTGYMPSQFGVFLGFDEESQELVELNDGPGEQALPVVLSTEDGSYAMGALAFEVDHRCRGPGYGRFRFPAQGVTKWNVVYRVREAQGIDIGPYRFRIAVLFGKRDEVLASLVRLTSH